MSHKKSTCASNTTAQTKKEQNILSSENLNSRQINKSTPEELSKEERLFFLKHVFTGFCSSDYHKQLTELERAEMAQTYTSLLIKLVS